MTVKENDRQKSLVSDIHLSIKEQAITALVGGSGSGKTTTGLAIMQLLAPALNVEAGKIFYKGDNVLNYSSAQMQKLRGKEIGMVFQEPLYAFNPLFSIGFQIEEVLAYHTTLDRHKRRQRLWELLDLVELPDAQRIARSYPHQLSGGMRQRAMIAQAIAANPRLIIADEPTSNLDVTLQAKIIELFKKLKDELKLSILLITHDLGMVNHLSDEINVMTEGKIVESGRTQDVLTSPQHPYTKRLVEAL